MKEKKKKKKKKKKEKDNKKEQKKESKSPIKIIKNEMIPKYEKSNTSNNIVFNANGITV